ncbi:hypothetical protein [Inediibacterium massiliense]|uniref:hypothetical protein n=1 Tax=Inediibacterium massiliense TaxID=1658111 RepID=UPI0018FE0597|nr:hypothetical protein [Inediibacterium massiliense]
MEVSNVMLEGFIITNKFESRFKCSNLVLKNGFVELYDVTFTDILNSKSGFGFKEYKKMHFNLDNVIEIKI